MWLNLDMKDYERARLAILPFLYADGLVSKEGNLKVVCMSRRATFLCNQSGSGLAYFFSVSFRGRHCESELKLAICVVNLSFVSNHTHRFCERR